jgi:cation diffusion facilitator family transporter
MSVPAKRKQHAAWLSVAANTAATLVKLAAAIATGSSAVLAEAAHSFADLTASAISLVSIRAADRPADPGHPFGHEKIEHVSGVLEGAMIMIAAVVVAVLAALHFGEPVERSALGIVVMIAFAIVNVLVSRRIRTVSEETASAALEADAAHLRADVLTSSGAAVALVLVSITGIHQIDGIVACGIAVLVARTGIDLIVRGTRVLVDVALPADEVEAIRGVLEQARPRGVVGYHRLRARRAGAVRHIDLHLQLDPTMTVAEAHEITDAIEAELAGRLDGADVVIHIEPATHEPEEDARLL